MDLSFKDTAQKDLDKLPKTEARKIFKKTQILKEFPFAGKLLGGEFEGVRSLRAWPYRILYHVDPKAGIKILTIKHRQGAYK